MYDNYMIIIKCKKCKQDKPESEFSVYHKKRNKTCKKCREENNAWYAQDLNGKRTKAKLYYQKRKPYVAKYRSDTRLAKKYSLTREAWQEMLVKQNFKCGICPRVLKNPCVDHDHKTGKVRALLCRRCNLDLQVVENEEFVKAAQLYLKSMK